MDLTNSRLFIIPGTVDAAYAKRLLSTHRIRHAQIDARKAGVLAYLQRDLGVGTLPALLTPSGEVYEGMEEIEDFIVRVR